MNLCRLIVVTSLVLVPRLLLAGTIFVPADQPTIQGAIDSSSDFDTIVVAPGTYSENISFSGKSILLISSNGRDSTFIEAADQYTSVVAFISGEDTTSIIDGFTVRNTLNASGVACVESSPIIRNCDISGCSRDGDGAGIYCEGSGAKIRGNRVHDNNCTLIGGGIYATGSSFSGVEIASNSFYGNSAAAGSGVGCYFVTDAKVLFNIAWDNVFNGTGYGFQSGGIYLGGTNSSVVSNTVAYNAHGITIYDGTGVEVKNNVVVSNDGRGIVPSDAISGFNCICDNGEGDSPGPDDISQDPAFFDVYNCDYSLLPGSPCIDAGDPDPIYNDPDGTRCDIGAIPFCSVDMPVAYDVQFGPDFIDHEIRTQAPIIFWTYIDTATSTQEQYEIEIGTDTGWETAEMWSTGTVYSPDTSASYAGLPLTDHVYYYLRIRLNNGISWGSWKQYRFLARFKTVFEVPGDFVSLQAGIDSLIDGDTLLVAAGTYTENIDFRGKSLSIIGVDGAEATTLQPAYPDSMTVSFNGGKERRREITGFTLTGSNADNAIAIESNSSAVISDCIFSNNSNTGYVIWCNSKATIERNLFRENGGVACVTFFEFAGPDALFLNNTLVNNARGVYIYFDLASPILKNNIIANNSGFGAAGSFGLFDYNDVWGNNPDYDNVYGAGEHNISEDPLFVDSLNNDFALQEGSPCIDAGDPDPQYNDPDGTRNDMGAFYRDYGQFNPYDLALESEELSHVVNHTPTFCWSIPDTFAQQAGYEIDVGIDNNWTTAEMWATGPVWDEDTSVTYSGLTLQDDSTYYVRLRLHSGIEWGQYDLLSFAMNSPPTVPVHVRPVDGESVPVNLVNLTLLNSTDTQGDLPTYDFEIYPSATPTAPADSQYEVLEQPDSTVSDVFTSLSANELYRWRSRAFDGYEYSDWSVMDSFYTTSVGVLRVPDEFPTIQAAVDAAGNGDSILVADGTYTGDGNRDIDFGGKLLKLVSEHGSENTIIDCQGSQYDNHRAFIFQNGESELAEIKGLTIKNGCIWTPDSIDVGGGMKCSGSSPTIVNCVLKENYAGDYGGGLYCISGSPILDSVEFVDNAAPDGAAMAIDMLSSPRLGSCQFLRNDLYIRGAESVTITGSSFFDCSGRDGGAITCYSALGTKPYLQLTGCELAGNSGQEAGGLYSAESVTRITECVFDSDTAENGGGGIQFLAGTAELTGCTFRGNYAGMSGGAVLCDQVDTISFRDCLFEGNETGDHEYATVFCVNVESVKFTGCTFDQNLVHALHGQDRTMPQLDSCTFTRNHGRRGTLYFAFFSAPFLTNCTFSNNYVEEEEGGAVACFDTRPILANCVVSFTSGSGAVYCPIAAEPVISCSNIYGNSGGDWIGNIADLYGVDGNISIDPMYCDTAGGDFRINVNSPCAPENNDCGVLIGSLGKGCGFLCGDADGSVNVDIDDVVYLIAYIFSQGPAPDPLESGDTDCSGGIDIDDVVYVIMYIFLGGYAPCDTDSDGVPDC
jgi:parallel beta-helix repeat protein